MVGHTSPFHEADGDYRTEKFMEGVGSSALPLYKLQSSLPKLPVPTLEETFARYLVSVQPLIEDHEYKATLAAAREFLRSGGLVRLASSCCSYSILLLTPYPHHNARTT